jgi:hypothetical protein
MLQQVIFNSLIILGIHALFWPGMILVKFRKYLERMPRFCKKPLFDCLICMSSVWGVTFFLCFNKLSWHLIPHVLAVCGLNVILDSAVYYWRRGGNRNFDAEKPEELL